MPRALRIQYPGAIYHVMNRGDRREPKGDVRKIAMARRLRAETSETLKWIADQLHLGTGTHVANRLQHATPNYLTTNQHELNLV